MTTYKYLSLTFNDLTFFDLVQIHSTIGNSAPTTGYSNNGVFTDCFGLTMEIGNVIDVFIFSFFNSAMRYLNSKERVSRSSPFNPH